MNPFKLLVTFLGRGMIWHTLNIGLLALVSWGFVYAGYPVMGFVLWISLIIIATIVIWRAGDFFEPAAEFIQVRRRLPESVKAAVIDAIASSFPEFCVAVIAVIIMGQAEVGISSIVGSALYNVLVIPAAAGLIASTPMKINHEVVWRDNLFYMGVVLLLMAALVFPQFSVPKEQMRGEIESKVIDIVSEQLGNDGANIKLESNFVVDLGADSRPVRSGIRDHCICNGGRIRCEGLVLGERVLVRVEARALD